MRIMSKRAVVWRERDGVFTPSNSSHASLISIEPPWIGLALVWLSYLFAHSGIEATLTSLRCHSLVLLQLLGNLFFYLPLASLLAAIISGSHRRQQRIINTAVGYKTWSFLSFGSNGSPSPAEVPAARFFLPTVIQWQGCRLYCCHYLKSSIFN